MVDSPALKQLMDMGIPRARAVAALVKAKDDVATAAERVFGGEHDDIPSDDDGDDIQVEHVKIAVNGNGSDNIKFVATQGSSGNVIELSSDEEGGEVELSDDEDAFDGFSDDDGIVLDEDDVDMDAARLRSDPYAGVFFSKDRVEVIIESVEPEDWASLASSGGPGGNVRLLTAGEWMSGCPEGNEQSFLFQLYNKLSADVMACAGGCGRSRERQRVDFFPILSDFQAYTRHLCDRIHHTCPNCQTVTCLACGAKYEASRSRGSSGDTFAAPDGKGKAKAAVGGPAGIEALLHCVDLQAVIIGMGLQIIETAFDMATKSYSATKEGSPSGSAKRQRDSSGASPVANPSKKVPVSGKSNNSLAGGSHAQSTAAAAAYELDDDEESVSPAFFGIMKPAARKNNMAKGTGYDGGPGGKEDTSGQKAAAMAEKARDAKTAALLRQVQVYLPQLDRPSGATTADHLVHPTTLAHLRRRSAFVNDLLRNDSLLDMSNRSELYEALFDWLQVISNHEALASMLAMPQMRPAKTVPVADSPDLVEVTYEGSPSPRELLENIVIQAQAALKGLQQGVTKVNVFEGLTEEEMNRLTKEQLEKIQKEQKRKSDDEGNDVLGAFCEKILASARTIDRSLVETKGPAFVERMRASLPRLPDAKDGRLEKEVREGLSGASKEAVMKIYEQWAGKARFQYADLLVPGTTRYEHAYQDSIGAIANQSNPKRSLAIAKELAILTTNLPVAWHSTIFLRVDETRVDVIKAMIIGPEGTPYENGCFMFDIFLPYEYNHHCPTVKYMTTNGGNFRYNPNLYADGKVCLSLLGTWSGPGWISGQSTLLQVLISIQSLILCEEPYCNEPGHEDSGSPRSKSYSANVRRMVVHDAMANNIKKPPRIFASEIRTHFRLKAQAIREQLDRWQAMDDGNATAGDSMSAAGYVQHVPQVGGTVLGGKKDNSKASGSASDFGKKAEALRKLLDDLESGKIGDGPDV